MGKLVFKGIDSTKLGFINL